MDVEKSIARYVELYDAIQEKTDSSEIAIAILQEIGKDRRTQEMTENGNGSMATEKQKDFLKNLKIEFSDSMTKKEASDLIDQALKG